MSLYRIKVEVDDSVFRRLGFKRTMDIKWRLESALERIALLAPQCVEVIDEIQEKKLQEEKISS